MKRYEKYKHSGVDWIGEIPEGWEVRKFKRLFKEKKKVINASLSSGSISFGEVVYKDDDKITEATKQSYQALSEGEFLLNPLNMNYDLKSLRIGLSTINVVVSSGYIILQSKNGLDKSYYRWLLRIYDIVFMKTLGAGVRQTINYNDLADSYLLLPSFDEQQAIAAFLDDKTAKIDQTIAIRQKEIDLLKERRQILIQKAVTKGLDDTVKLKPSGVDWIGEIPEHWACIKLKFLGKAIIGLTYSPNDLCDSTEGTLVLRSSNLLEGRFVYGEKENVYIRTKIPQKLMLEEDDILICSRNGSRDLIGKCAIAKPEDLENSFGAFTTVFRSKFNKYLFCILNSNIFKNLSGSFLTSTINQLTIGNLYSIQVPMPPKNEMSVIRIYVNSIEAKISKAISIKEQEIEKLKEYKTVLIDSVVTGKVKIIDNG